MIPSLLTNTAALRKKQSERKVFTKILDRTVTDPVRPDQVPEEVSSPLHLSPGVDETSVSADATTDLNQTPGLTELN